MTQLQEIKEQLAALTAKVESMTEGEYTFTEDQLVRFMELLNDKLKKRISEQISSISFDSDCVTLEMGYRSREIDVIIDESYIAETIIDGLELFDDEEDMKVTCMSILEKVKS